MGASDDLARRFLQGVGLAECSLAIAEPRLPSYCPGSLRAWRVVAATKDCTEALTFLSTLTWPATRHVVFAANNSITAFVNNSRNGSDYADEICLMPRHLGCRFARVVNQTQVVWRRDKLRIVQRYAARIFDLRGARGECIRSIACMNDGGRWKYHSSGTPHPLEATLADDSTRTSARFPSEQLAAVAAAYGFTLPTVEQFLQAGRYLLLLLDRPPISSCTIDEADDPAYGFFTRGMGYVKFMETHAASVVADFERCIEISPEYEPRVREYLREARRRLNEESNPIDPRHPSARPAAG